MKFILLTLFISGCLSFTVVGQPPGLQRRPPAVNQTLRQRNLAIIRRNGLANALRRRGKEAKVSDTTRNDLRRKM